MKNGTALVQVERLQGEIDIARVPALERQFAELPQTLQALIVDLSEVSFIDSSAIRLLHELNDRLRTRSQRLIVISPPGTTPRRALDLTAFEARVALADSLAAARSALGDGPA